MARSEYPEHEKLKAREREALTLSGFLDMLGERHFVLARYHEHDDRCDECDLSEERLYDFRVPTKEQLIGLFLDIDPEKLSAEKDAMYQELIAANQRASSRA